MVSDRLKAVANECQDATSKKTIHYCEDPYGPCKDLYVGAYTIDAYNIIIYCPVWFHLPAIKYNCDGLSSFNRAGIVVHEMTHHSNVCSPATVDYGYGTDKVVGLSGAKQILNADNFALYTMDLEAGCGIDENL